MSEIPTHGAPTPMQSERVHPFYERAIVFNSFVGDSVQGLNGNANPFDYDLMDLDHRYSEDARVAKVLFGDPGTPRMLVLAAENSQTHNSQLLLADYEGGYVNQITVLRVGVADGSIQRKRLVRTSPERRFVEIACKPMSEEELTFLKMERITPENLADYLSPDSEFLSVVSFTPEEEQEISQRIFRQNVAANILRQAIEASSRRLVSGKTNVA